MKFLALFLLVATASVAVNVQAEGAQTAQEISQTGVDFVTKSLNLDAATVAAIRQALGDGCPLDIAQLLQTVQSIVGELQEILSGGGITSCVVTRVVQLLIQILVSLIWVVVHILVSLLGTVGTAVATVLWTILYLLISLLAIVLQVVQYLQQCGANPAKVVAILQQIVHIVSVIVGLLVQATVGVVTGTVHGLLQTVSTLLFSVATLVSGVVDGIVKPLLGISVGPLFTSLLNPLVPILNILNAPVDATQLQTQVDSLAKTVAALLTKAPISPIIAVGRPGSGNTKVEVYNETTNEWSVAATLHERRERPATAWVGDNVIVAGGLIGTQVDTVANVNLITNVISNLPPLSERKNDASLIAFNGYLYCVGGYAANKGYVNTVERYDPKSNKWQVVTPISTARETITLIEVNGLLYAMGGHVIDAQSRRDLSTVECYDPCTDKWTTKASMLKPRRYFPAIAIDCYIYVTGGFEETGDRTIDRYDPATDTWTTVDTISTNIQPALFRDTDLFAKGTNGIVQKYNTKTMEWTELGALKEIRDQMAAFHTRTQY